MIGQRQRITSTIVTLINTSFRDSTMPNSRAWWFVQENDVVYVHVTSFTKQGKTECRIHHPQGRGSFVREFSNVVDVITDKRNNHVKVSHVFRGKISILGLRLKQINLLVEFRKPVTNIFCPKYLTIGTL